MCSCVFLSLCLLESCVLGDCLGACPGACPGACLGECFGLPMFRSIGCCLARFLIVLSRCWGLFGVVSWGLSTNLFLVVSWALFLKGLGDWIVFLCNS